MSTTDSERIDPVARLRARLDDREVIILDGGMGTEINARGAAFDPEAWSATVNLDAPEIVREAHTSFIDAGAEVIITNTFSTTRPRLVAAGREPEFETAVANAVGAAREAAAAAPRPVTVAGSIGLPGATVQPSLTDVMEYEEAYRIFTEQAELLASNGVDFLILEMVEQLDRGLPALRAALNTGLPVWLGISCRVLDSGELWSGTLPEPAQGPLEELLDGIIDDRVWAVVVMHSLLGAVRPALELIRERWDGPIGAYPHQGRLDKVNRSWKLEQMSPRQLVDGARDWLPLGAQIIGGCCGTGPEHIRALSEAVGNSIARAS